MLLSRTKIGISRMPQQHNFNVLDLYLDSKNPRHKPIENQSEIIDHLLKKEQVRNLARDIAKNGTSPIEQFAVIKDETGNYIVVEGNRRLCALLLLNDPEKAPDGEKSYFRNLTREDSNFPSNINCIEFDSREHADLWIERRHEGAQNGIGTKQWDAIQKTRHNTARAKPDSNALAQSLIDFAVKKNFIPSEKASRILTTATRYLSNPFFRKTIGVNSSSSQSDVELNVPISEFEKVLEQFSKDLLDDKSAVSSRSNKTDREKYARDLASSGYAPKTHGKTSKLTDHLNNKPQSTNTNNNNNNQSSNRHTQNPDKRKYFIPNDFKPRIKNQNLKRIFDELRALDADQYTLAATFLTRAFLETIFDLFHDKNIGGQLPKQTHLVMIDIQKHIQTAISGGMKLSKEESSAFGFFKKLPSEKHRQLNPENLGAFAHGSYYPNSVELRREWDNLQSFISYLFAHI